MQIAATDSAIVDFENDFASGGPRVKEGRIGGGCFILTAKQQAEAIRQIQSGEKSQVEVAELYRVSKATISRLVGRAQNRELLKR